jgi:hypothetical protein
MDLTQIDRDQYTEIANGNCGAKTVVLVSGTDQLEFTHRSSSQLIQKSTDLGFQVKLHISNHTGRGPSVLLAGEWGSLAIPGVAGDDYWQSAISVVENISHSDNPMEYAADCAWFIFEHRAQSVAGRGDVDGVVKFDMWRTPEIREAAVLLMCPSTSSSEVFIFGSVFNPIGEEALPYDRWVLPNESLVQVQPNDGQSESVSIEFVLPDVRRSFRVNERGYQEICSAGQSLGWRLEFIEPDAPENATADPFATVVSRQAATNRSIPSSLTSEVDYDFGDSVRTFGHGASYANPFWTDKHDWSNDPLANEAVTFLRVSEAVTRKRRAISWAIGFGYLIVGVVLLVAWLGSADANNNGGDQYGIPFGIMTVGMLPIFTILSLWIGGPGKTFSRLFHQASEQSQTRYEHWKLNLQSSDPDMYFKILTWEQGQHALEAQQTTARATKAMAHYARQTTRNTAAIRSELDDPQWGKFGPGDWPSANW